MCKLNGFKWLCVTAVTGILASTANAEISLIIDNQAVPGADIDSIVISPITGNLFVTTIPGYVITPVVVGQNVAITNFTLSPSTILAGESTTVTWNTANAASCTASNGVNGWANSVITLPTSSKTMTASTAGTYPFTLTCNGNTVGDTKSSTMSLTVNPANAVAITSFSASPASIAAGDSTTLSWATQNATSCTPSGGTGGWNAKSISLPNGSTQITAAAAGSYSFTLTCQDASGATAVKSSVVLVSPASQCATPALSGSVVAWKSFWLVDFPKPTYDNRYATVPRTGYLALEFNTANIVSKAKISTIESTVTDGVRLGSISQCPGDFDVPPECDHVWGLSGGIIWTTDGSAGCQLAPNTTYYFNLTYTDGVNPSTTTCSSSPCITTIQNINR